ncbi:MAG: GrpB family protein [Eubacteriaceae bacterium]
MNKLSEMTLEELWEIFPIILKEHSLEYFNWYTVEEKRLKEKLGHQIKRISHIGSSSVKGLIGKPTIDILLELTKNCNINLINDILKNDGWILMSKENKPEIKVVFNKGYTPKGFAEKVYHLHVRDYGDWNELYFRDYLSAHDDIAKEYGNLKVNLFTKYKHNRDGYTCSATIKL